MTLGRVMDRLGPVRQEVLEWHQGPEADSMWKLLTAPTAGLKISAHRCENCGLIELYARDER